MDVGRLVYPVWRKPWTDGRRPHHHRRLHTRENLAIQRGPRLRYHGDGEMSEKDYPLLTEKTLRMAQRLVMDKPVRPPTTVYWPHELRAIERALESRRITEMER